MLFQEVAVVALISSASLVAGWPGAAYDDIYAREADSYADYHRDVYAREANPYADYHERLYARDAEAEAEYEPELYARSADPYAEYEPELYTRDPEPYDDAEIDLYARQVLAYENYKAQHYRRAAAAKEAAHAKVAASSHSSSKSKTSSKDTTSHSSSSSSGKEQIPGKPDFTLFDKPSGSDVRSACPGLNALSNHYFLRHSGKGITKKAAVQAMADGLNVGQDVADLLWGGAQHWKLTHMDPKLGEVFDLDEVSRHGGIEHDGSLTRLDASEGDNKSVNPGLVAKFMAYFKGGDVTSDAAAHALDTRIKSNKKEHPKGDGDTPKTNIFSWGNLAMLIGTMGDVGKGSAPGGVVHTFLTEERLPVDQGWKRTSTKISLINMNVLIGKMQTKLGVEKLEDYGEKLKHALMGLL
ncbi:hypothetical protein MMC13_008071 [Lambiella insularis]|nr:hypothetical protein [Lambiella insularis]